MPADDSALLNRGGLFHNASRSEQPEPLGKQPRRSKSSASDHDSGTTGSPHQFGNSSWCGHVPVSDHGNPSDGTHHLPDRGPIRHATKLLFGRSAVDRDGSNALAFQVRGKVRCHDPVRTPTESEFRGHWNPTTRRPPNGVHDPAGQSHGSVRLAEQQRSAVPLCDLVDRAAHIDVHDLRAVIHRPRSGIGQRVSVAPVELNGQRVIGGMRGGQRHRPRAPSKHGVAVQQIRAGQADPPEFPA